MSQSSTLIADGSSSATETPGGNAALAERSAAHLSPILARYFQRAWVRGEGHRLWDADGKEYLDFACGLAVTILGHAHPRVSAAIHAQADQLLHMCNGLGYLEPVTALADALAATFPASLDSVFFANSGAEAIEGAVKLARRVTGRPAIIGFSGAFHGRTYAPLSLTTSNLNYRVGHGPFLPDTYISRFPSVYRGYGGDEAAAVAGALGSLRQLLSEQVPPSSVAAFLIEPVQGEGGYDPAPAAFLQGLREIADQHGILLISDEDPGGSRSHRQDVGLRARRHRARRGDPRQGHRQWAAARRGRGQQRPDAPLGRRIARFDLRGQPGLVRGGCRGAGDHPATSSWSRTPLPGAPS